MSRHADQLDLFDRPKALVQGDLDYVHPAQLALQTIAGNATCLFWEVTKRLMAGRLPSDGWDWSLGDPPPTNAEIIPFRPRLDPPATRGCAAPHGKEVTQ